MGASSRKVAATAGATAREACHLSPRPSPSRCLVSAAREDAQSSCFDKSRAGILEALPLKEVLRCIGKYADLQALCEWLGEATVSIGHAAPYSLSVPGSPPGGGLPSSSTSSIARCVIKRVGAAPCQWSSPGSNKTRRPGQITSIGAAVPLAEAEILADPNRQHPSTRNRPRRTEGASRRPQDAADEFGRDALATGEPATALYVGGRVVELVVVVQG